MFCRSTRRCRVRPLIRAKSTFMSSKSVEVKRLCDISNYMGVKHVQTFSFYIGLPSQNCRNKINKVFIELKNRVRAL